MARRGRRRRSCFGCLFRFVFYTLLICALALLAVYWLPVSIPSGPKEGLSVNEELPGDVWMNVLLLGTDSRDREESGRTDTMLIAAVNAASGEVKLISLMRDMMVDVPGHGLHKLNAAHQYGGAELVMRTVNEAFGMNITQYIVLDFSSFPYLIDSIGGVNLDVKESELAEVNKLVLGMSADSAIAARENNLDTSQLAAAGSNVRLTGLQALAFSRMRRLDSDYQRTSRQRQVIDATLKKARQIRNPLAAYSVMNTVFGCAETNIPAAQLTLIGAKVLLSGADMEVDFRLPVDGTFAEVSGSVWYIDADLPANRRLLREYIYGK